MNLENNKTFVFIISLIILFLIIFAVFIISLVTGYFLGFYIGYEAGWNDAYLQYVGQIGDKIKDYFLESGPALF